jgi:hypothetical protein
MILTIAEDFTSEVVLDSQLTDASDSGYYLNRGVDPCLTLENLLEFLPQLSKTPAIYSSLTTYGSFEATRKFSNVVLSSNKMYLSLKANNLNKTPASNPDYWLETNIESLRIRAFLWSVNDNFISSLGLNKRLIESNKKYFVGEDLHTPEGDYFGWCIQPRFSDYVKIKVNKIALQAVTTDPVNVYVVNNNTLITTLTVTPTNGNFSFVDLNYEFLLAGKTYFLVDSQQVKTDDSVLFDSFHNSFVAFPVTGVGNTPADCEKSQTFNYNGFSLDISTYLASDEYVSTNINLLGRFYQKQAEMDFLKIVLTNPNSVQSHISRNQQAGINSQIVATQILELGMNTVAKEYQDEKKIAVAAINKTLDAFLRPPKNLSFNVKTSIA